MLSSTYFLSFWVFAKRLFSIASLSTLVDLDIASFLNRFLDVLSPLVLLVRDVFDFGPLFIESLGVVGNEFDSKLCWVFSL